MKYVIRILFSAVVVLVSVGYYFKNTGNNTLGDKWVGMGILGAAFVLMPIFIFHRWKDKKVKDYMLTEENIRKMNDYTTKKKGKEE